MFIFTEKAPYSADIKWYNSQIKKLYFKTLKLYNTLYLFDQNHLTLKYQAAERSLPLRRLFTDKSGETPIMYHGGNYGTDNF